MHGNEGKVRLSQALALAGGAHRAQAVLERTGAYVNRLCALAAEVVDDGEMLGNFHKPSVTSVSSTRRGRSPRPNAAKQYRQRH
jgi:hypothetical protein